MSVTLSGKVVAMRKALPIVTIVALATLCCALTGYRLLVAWQLGSMRVLGWEEDHYLWMAGTSGVVRWDVNRQVVVNRDFRPDGISHFFISSEGQVWGYGDEIWLFDAGKWIAMGETAGLHRGRIYDMGQTADGTIWVATWWGFKRWSQETRLWESMLIDLPGRTLVQGPDNSLWFGLAEDGVIRIRSGELTHWTTADGLIDNRIESLLVAGDGTIWVGTRRGVSHWDGDQWRGWEHLGYPDPDGLVVYELYETSNGTLWAATSEDLAKWDNEEWTTFTRSPSCFTVFALLEADDGSFWVGCVGGLFRWTESGWREYGKSEGVPDSSVSRLIQGANGTMYATTRSGRYQYIPEEDRWQPFPNR